MRRRAGVSPYKPDAAAAIAAIDGRRLAAGLSVSALAARAGIDWRTLMRIRKSGRAWRREIAALKMALRQIEKDARAESELFPGDQDADTGTSGAGRA